MRLTKKRIRRDDEPANASARHGRKSGFEVAVRAGLHDMKLNPKRAGSHAGVTRDSFRIGIGRIDEQRNRGRRRTELMQQLKPLRHQLHIQSGDAGEIAAWPSEARDQAELHRIDSGSEHDRNRRGCRLRGCCRNMVGDDDARLATNQFGGQCRQSVVLLVGPAVFDGDILAFGEPGFTKAVAES